MKIIFKYRPLFIYLFQSEFVLTSGTFFLDGIKSVSSAQICFAESDVLLQEMLPGFHLI